MLDEVGLVLLDRLLDKPVSLPYKHEKLDRELVHDLHEDLALRFGHFLRGARGLRPEVRI